MTNELIGWLLIMPIVTAVVYTIIHEAIAAINGDKLSQIMIGWLVMTIMMVAGAVILAGAK